MGILKDTHFCILFYLNLTLIFPIYSFTISRLSSPLFCLYIIKATNMATAIIPIAIHINHNIRGEEAKRDADFCYAFVSQTILNWQLTQEKPLYEVDMSNYPQHRHDKKIAGVSIPEIYPEKMCYYATDDDTNGELMFLDKEAKENLQRISSGQICFFENRITNEETGALFREYKEFIMVTACEFNLVLNNGPLWEFMLYYRTIPFTTTSDLGEQIDIDHIEEYSPQNDAEENFKRLVINFGVIDTAEKAFELNSLLNADEFDSLKAKGIISSNLISILQGNS